MSKFDYKSLAQKLQLHLLDQTQKGFLSVEKRKRATLKIKMK